METLRARLEIGRRIAVADPERVEIRHDLPRFVERELPIELQPVGRRRNPRVLLRAHERGENLDRIYRMDRIQILLIRSSCLHLLRDLDSEQVETFSKNPPTEFAEREARAARGLFGFQDGAGFVE